MRRYVVALVVSASMAALVGCGVMGGGRPVVIDYYWADAEGNLVIQVTTGDLTATEVTDVDESAEAVSISVRSLSAPVPVADIGYALNLIVALHQPLGDRRVIDGSSGKPVSLCRDVVACEERGTAQD